MNGCVRPLPHCGRKARHLQRRSTHHAFAESLDPPLASARGMPTRGNRRSADGSLAARQPNMRCDMGHQPGPRTMGRKGAAMMHTRKHKRTHAHTFRIL
eukprot:15483518-Alexandrium_andersonii.AAC.2